MKKLIAVWGVANAGKSASIKMAYEMIKATYPLADIDMLSSWEESVDISRIITIGNAKIGLESQGDPGTEMRLLKRSLPRFAQVGCQLIICPTRTRGATVDGVKTFARRHDYKVSWHRKERIFSPDERRDSNQATAEEIMKAVRNLVGG